jgi:hypothetical protein
LVQATFAQAAIQPLQPGQQRPFAGLLRRPGGEATGPSFAALLPRLLKLALLPLP